ncbi:hypothetical protein Cpin_2268 [Chitinophaga pinensis DSM 2588]|uniref:Uncharacterized protein n=2 Tax=Chitinophaga pinensis TaxID=79329 RepID=A0A979G2T3_CHIPD|nr:hypothetical protein Cpin_2268 [Chitinophaga pinensis DSM 2588]
MNYLAGVLLLTTVGAFASSEKRNSLDLCSTVPTTSGPSINSECPYSPATQCCYIAAGSTAQYVTQTQPDGTVIIRRNAGQMTTIYGLR